MLKDYPINVFSALTMDATWPAFPDLKSCSGPDATPEKAECEVQIG